jgi:DNA sulfur modification protein DndB
MNQKTRTLFPSLRSRMGETIYYTTSMTFRDVCEWIKPTDEVHKSKKLSEWIQRQLISRHADGIASYLREQNERFFNAIVVGIYGGQPKWAPLDVGAPAGEKGFSDEQQEYLESSIGLLTFNGNEKLFAIDGQHRVSGIKKVLEDSSSKLAEDEIIAIIVGHSNSESGKQRTRRLFTTLNKTARRVSEADRIALDEDDGFAVTVRRLVDESEHFSDSKLIEFASSTGLSPSSDAFTTIINLYHQIKDLYSPKILKHAIKSRDFCAARPSETDLIEFYELCNSYFALLRKHISAVDSVLSGKAKASGHRKPNKNHLLLRPIGQRAFASAVGVLVERGATVKTAVMRLSKVELWIHENDWWGILWDSDNQLMLKSVPLAESYLLHLLKEQARTIARQKKLEDVLGSRNLK